MNKAKPVVERQRDGTLSDWPAPVPAPVIPKITGYFSLSQACKRALRLLLPTLLLLLLFFLEEIVHMKALEIFQENKKIPQN